MYFQLLVAVLWLCLGLWDTITGRDIGERFLGVGFLFGAFAFAQMARQSYLKTKQ